jgi:hypothetical protein
MTDCRWFGRAAVIAAVALTIVAGRVQAQTRTQAQAPFQPPAVPLVAHDPYFSIWSTGDRLTDGPTRHWTGRAQPLTSLVRIDGRVFRALGHLPANVPAMSERSRTVFALRSPTSRPGHSRLPVAAHDARPRAVHRLVPRHHRSAARLPGALGGRRSSSRSCATARSFAPGAHLVHDSHIALVLLMPSADRLVTDGCAP